jgi:hypothetical protein
VRNTSDARGYTLTWATEQDLVHSAETQAALARFQAEAAPGVTGQQREPAKAAFDRAGLRLVY